MLMRRLSAERYRQLTAGAVVLARDDFGDKVLRLPDGRGVKLFRRKQAISSNNLWPYARRFRHAARCLARRGIPTVLVDDLFRVEALKRDVVVYRYLEGVPLRQALDHGDRAALLESFAGFLAQLHGKGIYFRAIHFANVVLTPAGEWGLIDVSEARFRPWGLWVRLRARNFKPLLRYPQDRAALEAVGPARFLGCYLRHADLTASAAARLAARLARLDSRFANPV